MTSFRTMIQNTFTAVAFAEHGEHETAREFLSRTAPARPLRLWSWLNTLRSTFAAAAFAEAGLPEVAMEVAGLGRPVVPSPGPTLEEFMRQVGLAGVPAHFGIARV